jgi:hypothetical protein
VSLTAFSYSISTTFHPGRLTVPIYFHVLGVRKPFAFSIKCQHDTAVTYSEGIMQRTIEYRKFKVVVDCSAVNGGYKLSYQAIHPVLAPQEIGWHYVSQAIESEAAGLPNAQEMATTAIDAIISGSCDTGMA